MERNQIMKPNEEQYIDHIHNISVNPFFASRLIHSFFTGYNQPIAPMNLIYIILPLIYYHPSRNLLIKAKNISSIRSLFIDNSEKSISLGGLQERLLYFERCSNLGLIIAVNEDKLTLTSEGVTLNRKIDYKDVLNKNVKDYIRAAHYLGLLCSKLELTNIYRLLGVTVR